MIPLGIDFSRTYSIPKLSKNTTICREYKQYKHETKEEEIYTNNILETINYQDFPAMSEFLIYCIDEFIIEKLPPLLKTKKEIARIYAFNSPS